MNRIFYDCFSSLNSRQTEERGVAISRPQTGAARNQRQKHGQGPVEAADIYRRSLAADKRTARQHLASSVRRLHQQHSDQHETH